MRNRTSRLRVAAVAACGAALVFTTAGGADAAAAKPNPKSEDAQIAALVQQLGDSGISQGSGSANLSSGSLAAKLRSDLKAAPKSVGPYNLPKCQGTYKFYTADVTLNESMRNGIQWKVALNKKVNGGKDFVNFKTQIFAEGVEAKVTPAQQKQKRTYNFHGTLPTSFPMVDSKAKSTIPRGGYVSFFWSWKSMSNPDLRGYRFTNCAFQP